MLKKSLAILTGSLFIALGVNYFVIPHHLLDGGIIGIGLIANYAFGVKPGLTIILLSIPLYSIAFFYNRRYFYNGVHGLLVSSFFIDVFSTFTIWNPSSLLFSSLTGGVFIGTGIGIMLVSETSTGGTDLLALILAKRTAINAGIYIFMIDSIILLAGWFFIPEVTFIYSCIMVGIIGFTTSTILHRFT
ncbi:YitT family protein [Virgibacillus ainsalahensis]